MNLRTDDTFVEDDGWHAAARRYEDFLRRHKGEHILFWELGRYSKIFFLENDSGKSQSGVCLYQLWGGLCAKGNLGAVDLY